MIKVILGKNSYIINQFNEFISSSISSTDQKIESWISENKVHVYPISNTSIEEVFQNYFAGTGAFRGKKQRQDIPDAVIYDCILKLSENEKILVVAKDGALIDAISSLKNVTIYKALSEVIEIPVLDNKISELNAGERKVESIINTLNSFDCTYEISIYINDNDLVEIQNSYGRDFIALPYEISNIETTDCKASITNLKDLNIEHPTYLGNESFSYNITIDCEASLFFKCDNDAYEFLPYEYRKVLLKDELTSKDEVEVQGDVDATLQGVLILSGIDESTESSQLKVHLSYLGADQNPIRLEIDLEKLQIEDIY